MASCVKADQTQMQMVLSAVLNNASEAMDGKGLIKIFTTKKEINRENSKNYAGLNPGSYICLTVEDNGTGMNEETRDRLFEPFFSTKFQGRGLSMAAAYGIVRNHGGSISVDSEVGKGTAVRIYLPVSNMQIKAEKERPKYEMTQGEGTILIIEDEEVVMDLMRVFLEKLGYSVLEATTGKKAVDIVQTFESDIDLAILDLMLPDMEGKTTFQHLKEARPDLKVIICSGYSIDGPAQEIINSGAQDFIQKPFSLNKISEKLKKVLEGKSDRKHGMRHYPVSNKNPIENTTRLFP